jgi:hypothetical protein
MVDECEPLMQAMITRKEVIPDRDYLISTKDVDNIRMQVNCNEWMLDLDDAKLVVGPNTLAPWCLIRFPPAASRNIHRMS